MRNLWKVSRKCMAVVSFIVFCMANMTFVVYGQSESLQNSELTLYLSQESIDTTREIFYRAVENGLCSLNENGTINLMSDDTETMFTDVEWDMLESYINSLNDIAEIGTIIINESFDIESLPSDEITELTLERDEEISAGEIESDNIYDDIFELETDDFGCMSISSTLPTLNAYAKATVNRKKVVSYLSTLSVQSPTSAWTNTVAWWVAKVKEGGSWDYKSVSGYSPYNKKWYAVQRYTTSVKTTEWFGNYNYGFTGSVLFTQSELLLASNAVNWGTSFCADDADDIAAVKQGYSESQ